MTNRSLPLLLGTSVIVGLARLATADSTTTTTSTSTTSTTTVAPTCDNADPGSLIAVGCRLDALAAAIDAEPALATYQAKLGSTLARAVPMASQAEAACGTGDVKTASRRLKQAKTLLEKMAHRLRGLSARKKLDAGVRTDFIRMIDDTRSQVSTLRKNPCGSA